MDDAPDGIFFFLFSSGQDGVFGRRECFAFLKRQQGFLLKGGFGGETTSPRRALARLRGSEASSVSRLGLSLAEELCSFASLLKWASFEPSKKFDEQSEKKKNRTLPSTAIAFACTTYQMLMMVELYW